jgi:hypothetical protein
VDRQKELALTNLPICSSVALTASWILFFNVSARSQSRNASFLPLSYLITSISLHVSYHLIRIQLATVFIGTQQLGILHVTSDTKLRHHESNDRLARDAAAMIHASSARTPSYLTFMDEHDDQGPKVHWTLEGTVAR